MALLGVFSIISGVRTLKCGVRTIAALNLKWTLKTTVVFCETKMIKI